MIDLVVSGSLLVILIAGIIGYFIYEVRNLKKCHKEDMVRMEDKVVLRDNCIERHKVINNRLQKGENTFDRIMDTLTEQGKTLVRIDERTLELAKKNGVNTD